jgi:hypothetical protein
VGNYFALVSSRLFFVKIILWNKFMNANMYLLLEKGFEEAKPVIAALKEKGMSAIGAAGYCWGSKYHLSLCRALVVNLKYAC